MMLQVETNKNKYCISGRVDEFSPHKTSMILLTTSISDGEERESKFPEIHF